MANKTKDLHLRVTEDVFNQINKVCVFYDYNITDYLTLLIDECIKHDDVFNCLSTPECDYKPLYTQSGYSYKVFLSGESAYNFFRSLLRTGWKREEIEVTERHKPFDLPYDHCFVVTYTTKENKLIKEV